MNFMKSACAGSLLIGAIFSPAVIATQGDIHGRDLAITGLGWAGHVGVEAANGNVLEMLSGKSKTSAWGYKTYLTKNSKSSFKRASPYWGAKYSSYLLKNHYWRIRDYVIKNADYIEDIGANYTSTRFYSHPRGYKDSSGTYRIALGKYRCDTYVRSMYETGGIRYSGNNLPRTIYNKFPNKR